MSNTQNSIPSAHGTPQLDAAIKNMMSNAMADEHEFHLAEKTINEKKKFTRHVQEMLQKMNMIWSPKDSPCPVDGLYIILKIAGTPKGKPIGENSGLTGAGHSMSHVEALKKYISATNEENGWKSKVLYPDNYAEEHLRGEPENSAHNSKIKKLVSALKKKTERDENRAQPFLRYHLVKMRNMLLGNYGGIFGIMVYTLILFSFWLALRASTVLQIRIEGISLQHDNKNEDGLPTYVDVYVKLQKSSKKITKFRLWSYSEEDPEVCPVIHLMMLLKLTGWKNGFLFWHPLSRSRKRASFSVLSMPYGTYQRVYNDMMKLLFPNSTLSLPVHGPRRSIAQLMKHMKWNDSDICKYGQWKKLEDAMRYSLDCMVLMDELNCEEDKREFPEPKTIFP